MNKKYGENVRQAKLHTVGQYVWVFQNAIPPKGTNKLLKKWRGPFGEDLLVRASKHGRARVLDSGTGWRGEREGQQREERW